MAFIAVPNVAEVVMQWQHTSGAQMLNVLHVREATLSGWTLSALTALCGIVRDWDAVNASAHRSSEVTLTQVRARDLTTANGAVTNNNTPVVGALASPMLPSNVTMAISLRTGLAGRSFRGRIYFVGLTESQVTGNYVNAPNAAEIVADYNDLKTLIASASGALVVVSRFSLGAPRAVGIATDVTQILTVDNRVDTQRRRLS